MMSNYKPVNSVTLQDIQQARERISNSVKKTPLIPLNVELEGQNKKIFLKLENLHPIGSFKIRGACNAVCSIPHKLLENGVYTASAGNFAQGLAWNAKLLGVPCQVVMPDHAPEAKVKPTLAMGASVTKVTFDRWWHVVVNRKFDQFQGTFIHPVSEASVIAGNGTIGLEILEDVPNVDTIIVPYGGGGLSSGIAIAAKGMKPNVKVFACEVDTAAPLSAAFKEGKPVKCQYTPSFVDGMGSSEVLAEMWPLVKEKLDGSLVISLSQVAEAVKLLANKNHVIAEGAGAAPVAAALTADAGEGNIVCVVSGGNIDPNKLIHILQGSIPGQQYNI
ncbi:L-threonine dehydratase catabolic tdcb-like [Plakobranchus ocellatus]|uniref:L-serine deaminase n=1 Tax=Plakobranchus ocellatus TaxID=259542 RepID=A0AAV3Z374_9GAST|nr:L-threonine dehydratase catabolic tdcb-like [Plakobranchus ocellatus]